MASMASSGTARSTKRSATKLPRSRHPRSETAPPTAQSNTEREICLPRWGPLVCYGELDAAVIWTCNPQDAPLVVILERPQVVDEIPREWAEGLQRLEASTSISGMLPLDRLRLVPLLAFCSLAACARVMRSYAHDDSSTIAETAAAEMRREDPTRHALPVSGNAKRSLQAPRRDEHRAENDGGSGEDCGCSSATVGGVSAADQVWLIGSNKARSSARSG
jgi:hypothetical protein